MRRFTWADLEALAHFINRVRKHAGDDQVVSPPSLREELARPGLIPEQNCFLLEEGQSILAYSLLHPELRIGRTVLEVGTHPEHPSEKDIMRQVVRGALAHARTVGSRVLHVCQAASTPWKAVLAEEGFSEVRAYWLMRWEEEELPPAEPVSGFDIERFQVGDEERLTRVQNASFDGSWGFCPNTVEEVRYKASMSTSGPEGIFFLTHRGDDAAYCWTCVLAGSHTPIGVIDMIGVPPDYRSRGLSRPILLAGMEHLRSRGVGYITLNVDQENHPAVRLYTSVGFTKSMELHWFEAVPSAS